MRIVGFPPIIGNKPKVLILGSMPGEESLNKCQYYANSRNTFWEIMGRLFQFNHNADYIEKIEKLIDKNIALWDVIKECQRKGSLDDSIIADSIKVNDFVSLYTEHLSIKYVFFNGRKAEKEYRKRIFPNLESVHRKIKYELLPSTSPAYTKLTKLDKIEKWSKIKSILMSR